MSAAASAPPTLEPTGGLSIHTRLAHDLTDGALQRTARLDYSGPKMEGENKKFPPTIRHSATWTGRGTYSRPGGLAMVVWLRAAAIAQRT
jgi:hypothetical protein